MTNCCWRWATGCAPAWRRTFPWRAIRATLSRPSCHGGPGGGGAAGAGCAGAAADHTADPRPCRVGQRVGRHRRLPRRRAHRQHLGVRRGSGDVPRQAGRAQRAALLRTRDAGAHAAFAGAGRRPQGRGAPRRAVPGVPAPAHAGQRRTGGRRGAAALAASALGAGVSGRVHPDRRAKRLHRGPSISGWWSRWRSSCAPGMPRACRRWWWR